MARLGLPEHATATSPGSANELRAENERRERGIGPDTNRNGGNTWERFDRGSRSQLSRVRSVIAETVSLMTPSPPT